MKIKLKNNECKVFCEDITEKSIFRELKDLFKYRVPGYKYTSAYKKGTWDGFKSPITSNKFATGLLPLVCMELKALGQEYEIEDLRDNVYVPPAVNQYQVGEDTLYPYQQKVVNKLYPTFQGFDWFRGINYQATNAGKTHIMAWILLNTPKDCNILFLVHRLGIFRQVYEFFNSFSGELGEIGVYGELQKGKPMKELRRITVAMQPSMSIAADKGDYELLEYLSSLSVVMVDEAHTAKSATYQDLLSKINAYSVYFFSGTALSGKPEEDYVFVGSSGPTLSTVRNEELINLEISQKIKVTVHDLTYGLRLFTNTKEEINSARYSEERIEIIKEDFKQNPKEYYLIYVEKTEHGQWVYEQLLDLPAVVEFTHGQDPDIEEKKRQFKEGNIQVMIATSVFSTGLNISIINCLVFLPTVSSKNIVLQVVGRLLRRHKDIKNCRMIDFIDHGQSVKKHANKRLKMYKEESFDIEIIKHKRK